MIEARKDDCDVHILCDVYKVIIIEAVKKRRRGQMLNEGIVGETSAST